MLACTLALLKLGATASLVNTNLTGRQLVHCITATGSVACIAGEEVFQAVNEVAPQLNLPARGLLWVRDDPQSACPATAIDLLADAAGRPVVNPETTALVKAGDIAFYIFTSGTTGLPKAAVITHRRYLFTAYTFCHVGFHSSAEDRIYLCLPLYHGTALTAGIGTSLLSGAAVFLRRRFSASRFWPEVRQYRTNLFVYVGELCRYLVNQPPVAEERDNPLQRVVGNGLRPDIWRTFRRRFDIGRIGEFYGASEGNVGFINALDKDCTIGATSADILLATYDVERDEIVRDAGGRVRPVKRGQPGLLLARIDDTFRFEGYRDAQATERKVLRDVRVSGDAWFNTGDLVRQVEVGFAMGLPHYQFVDRVGDTFRWRSENVSTGEVEELINGFPQVELANVYGVAVPGAEGRAGMAALYLHPGQLFDSVSFSHWVNEHLPGYARPVFVRILPRMDTTATFKLVKNELRNQAFHPDKVEDPLYVLKPGAQAYCPLDEDFYRRLMAGQGGY